MLGVCQNIAPQKIGVTNLSWGLHREEEVDLLKERGGVVEDAAGLAVQGGSKFLAGITFVTIWG